MVLSAPAATVRWPLTSTTRQIGSMVPSFPHRHSVLRHGTERLTCLGTCGKPFGELFQALVHIPAHSLLHLLKLVIQGLLLL